MLTSPKLDWPVTAMQPEFVQCYPEGEVQMAKSRTSFLVKPYIPVSVKIQNCWHTQDKVIHWNRQIKKSVIDNFIYVSKTKLMIWKIMVDKISKNTCNCGHTNQLQPLRELLTDKTWICLLAATDRFKVLINHNINTSTPSNRVSCLMFYRLNEK